MSKQSCRIFVAAALISGVLAACGDGSGSESKSDEEQVRSVVEQYTDAAVDGDYEKACSLLTSEAKQDVLKAGAFVGNKGGGCSGILEAVIDFSDESEKAKLRNLEITAVRITGDKAVVTDSTGDTSNVRKKGGKWLVDSNPEEK